MRYPFPCAGSIYNLMPAETCPPAAGSSATIEIKRKEMNERQLKVKQRVLALLPHQDNQEISVARGIESLSNSPDSGNFCAELLKFFVHTKFEEEEAQHHWEKIFENHDYYLNQLHHDVGLRVAIFDYFVNLSKVVSSPIMVEIHIFREAEKLAMVDSLTGIFNRRYFDLSLRKEIKRALRYGKTFSLLLIDMDDFKKINDTRGHLFGDSVLIKLATLLTSISREEDIPCRFGGEEFAVVLPETNAKGAFTFAERLRSEMRSHEFFREHQVTFSGGISSYPKDGNNISALLAVADKALYEAKFSGKDCCILKASQEPKPGPQ